MQVPWVLNWRHLPSGSVLAPLWVWGLGRDSHRVGKGDNTLVYLAGSRELRELLAARIYPDKYLTGLYQTKKVGTSPEPVKPSFTRGNRDYGVGEMVFFHWREM